MSNLVNQSQTKGKLLFEEESYQIIGACIAVHKKLGVGFKSTVYQEALQKEFIKKEIPFTKQQFLPMYYDGQPLQKQFEADFVCYDKIFLDIRVVKRLLKEDQQQVVNYLKATKMQIGLLINFGELSLSWKRLIHTT